MGRPMALHLAQAGHHVHVYNRTHAKAFSMEPMVKAFSTIEECVKDCEVIITLVGYPKDVEETYETVMKNASKGAILIDMTTSSPSLAKKLYLMGRKKGYYVLDAPVTGGDLGAINGTLSIMVGGDFSIYEKVYPLFTKMGKTINYMGNAGSGMHAKLANQIAIAGAIAGLSEALRYAQIKELDLERMLGVITGGSANSWQAQNNGPKMIQKDYTPGFFVKHFLKDLRLAMDEKEGLPLDVLSMVTKAYETLVAMGHQDDGTQSLIEVYLNPNVH